MTLFAKLAQLVLIAAVRAADISVVSYNAYWWNVRANNRWSQLYNRVSSNRADLYGFQECENIEQVLQGAGIGTYQSYQGPNKPAGNPAPLAWNGQVFTKIDGPGEFLVASDRYGARYMTWVRLRHTSGATVLFANTHGPLGDCGNTLGDNWRNGIITKKQTGDTVIFTGDFNCGLGTPAMRKVLLEVDQGVKHGIDHILTGAVASGSAVNGWPSDHPLIKGTISIGGTSPSPSGPCEAAWNNDADGYRCGARIRWLQGNRGLTEDQAKNQVAAEFPNACGDCGPGGTDPVTTPKPAPTCESVLNNVANGYSCGSRIQWLKNNRGMTETEARNTVAGEFPPECGACSSLSGGGSSTTSCRNQYNDCGYWAQIGYCTDNRWKQSMECYCRPSCNLCQTAPACDFIQVQASVLDANVSMSLPASPTIDELYDGFNTSFSSSSSSTTEYASKQPTSESTTAHPNTSSESTTSQVDDTGDSTGAAVVSGCIREVASMSSLFVIAAVVL